MNIFSGIINLNSAPVNLDMLVILMKKHQKISIGSDYQFSISNFSFVNSQFDLSSCCFLSNLHQNIHVVGDVRLDNKKQLIDLLYAVKNFENDFELIIECYLTFGEKCASYFLGDFQFVLYDGRSSSAYLMQGVGSGERIFYLIHDGSLYFSNIELVLLELPFFKKTPNIQKVLSSAIYSYYDTEKTYFNGIEAVSYGCYLKIKNNKLVKKRYWSVPDKVQHRNIDDHIDEFLYLFYESIKCRLSENDTASELSGGLDSSSVTAIAAEILSKKGLKIKSFCAIPADIPHIEIPDGYYFDPKPYVSDFLSIHKNVDLHYVRYEDGEINMFNINKNYSIPFGVGSLAGNPNISWMLNIINLCNQHGLTRLLTGVGGNYTIYYVGVDSPFRQRLRKIYHYFHFIKNNIARNLFCWEKNYPYLKASLFNKFDIKKPATFNVDHIDSYISRMIFGLNASCEIRSVIKPYCVSKNVSVLDPTFDKRIIEFCLSIRETQYRNAFMKRLLVRKAMKGRLPDSIRLCQKIGIQYPNWSDTMRAHKSEIKSICHSIQNIPEVSRLFNLPILEYRVNQLIDDNNQNPDRNFLLMLLAMQWVAMNSA